MATVVVPTVCAEASCPLDTSLPSAVASYRVLHGDLAGIPEVLWEMTFRAVAVGYAAYAAGLRDLDVIKAAVGGTLGIQTAVFGYVGLFDETSMPSSDTAGRVLQGDPEAILLAFRDFGARMAFLAIGMYILGLRGKKLLKAAFAGAVIIEIAVFADVWFKNQNKLIPSVETLNQLQAQLAPVLPATTGATTPVTTL